MSVPTTAPETTAYRQKLALHILPHSPALALRYASRLRKLNPSLPPLTPISCPRCGNMFAHGRGTIRMVRQVVLKECYACGEITSVPRPTSHAKAAFPSVRARKNAASQVAVDQVQHEVKTVESARTNATRSPHPAPVPSAAAQRSATKRPKSKGGLQDMLQRNREREMRESQNDSNSVGLASFLQEL